MRNFRIFLGLTLFALAGVVGWVAWKVGADAPFTWLMLWAVAASLAWKGIMAFLGRIEPLQTPAPSRPAPSTLTPTDPAWSQKSSEALSSPSVAPGDRSLDTPPPAVRTDHLDVMRAAWEAVKSTGLVMRRVITVLVLLLLVPATVGLSIGGMISLYEGDVPKAAVFFVVAGWLGWLCCWGPLRALWGDDGDERSRAGGDETRAGAQSGREYAISDGTASDNTAPMSAPAQLSLPEEFLLLSYRYGDAHDYDRSAVACAGAELGELALRRRVQVAPRKWKTKLFHFQGYVSSGEIHVLDLTPTGLAWADDLLAELERLANPPRRHMPSDTGGTASRSRPISVYKWLRLRGDKALLLHRKALTERRVLLHSPGFRPGQEERHYPDPSVRNELISRLRAVDDERIPMDEHMLLLLNLVAEAGLNDELGLTMSTHQPLDRARGSGAVAALSDDMRDTSAVLAMNIAQRNRGGGADGGGGDGGDGGE